MATTAAELLVKVGADVSEAQRKLDGMSRQFDGLRAGAMKMAMGVTAAAAAIGAAAVAYSAKAIQAGSDLAESQNKIRVVFGESAASIEAWANNAAQNLAMTQQQALEASGTFGNLFDSMGIAEQNAAKMSQSLVQLAADLASFNNIGVDVALEKLQSGLVGETEPLRALGVNLNAATTEAKALEMGLAATAQQLTAADMATARYALILDQTKNAQGDLARTSDGWANQMRILQANLADVTAEIGQRLLPAILPFLQKLTEFVQQIGPEVVRIVGEIVNGFTAMGVVLGQLDLSVPIGQFGALNQALGMNVWAEVFGFLTEQIALTILNFKEAGLELARLGEEIKLTADLIKGDLGWNDYLDQLKALREEYQENQKVLQAHYEAIKAIDYSDVITQTEKVIAANAEATDWWQRHRSEMQQTGDAVSAVGDQVFSLAAMWTQAYDAMQTVTSASMDASRMKVLETFNVMAQDYAQHAQTIVDLENRKGQMIAYLESVYQQHAAALQAAGQTQQLADLTTAHNAKLKAVVASYNTQISLEKTGQVALLSNAKKYYLTTLQMMSRALIAQVATVKANMLAMVRMIVSGYGSASAAAYAFNKIKEGITNIGAIQAAIAEVTAAFNAIEGAGIGAITEASDAFKDWQASIGDVADGLDDVGNKLDGVGGGAGKVIDPIQAAANVVNGLAAMIEKAIQAFNTLAEWGGPEAGWVEKFDQLAQALATMVRRWAVAVQSIMDLLSNEETRTALGQFAELTRAIMASLQSAITVLGALEQYDGTFEVSAQAIENILAFVRFMAEKIAEIADEFETEALNQAKLFAETAGMAVKLIADAVTAILRLEEFESDRGTYAVIDEIAALVGYLVQRIAEIADAFTSQALSNAARFADSALTVIKLLSDAIGALVKLADFGPTKQFPKAVRDFVARIVEVVQQFSLAAALIDEDLAEAAATFAAAAGPVVKLVSDAIGGLMKMQEWAPRAKFPAMARALAAQLTYLVQVVSQAAAEMDTTVLDAAKSFAAAAGPVAKAIGDAIGGLMAFKEYDRSMSLAHAGADRLVGQIAAFVRKLARLGSQLAGPALDDAKAFAAAASPVVKLIRDAIDGMMAFKDYDKAFSLADAGANQLVAQIAAFVRKLARLGNQIGGPALDAAKDFAATAKPVIEVIGDAIEGFMKFKDYDQYFSLAGAGAGHLVEQLQVFVRKFARLGQSFGQPALTAAQQFAEAAGDVVDTISDALDLLTKIKSYVSPSYNALLAFERDVEDMLLRFVRWVTFVIQPIAANIDREAMAAMEDMVGALQAALELLNGMVDFVSPTAAQMQAFMDAVDQLATDFFEWATTNGPQLFKEIPPEFLSAFRDVFDGLSAAVDVLTALIDFVAPSVIAVMQFEEGYQRLFMDWLTWAQNNLWNLKSDVLTAIAGVFNDVMGGLQTAVDVLTGLVDYVAPSAFAIMTFEEGYQRLFQGWVTWATGTFADLNIEIVEAVASVFSDVFDGLGAAVTTLTQITGYVSPGQAAIAAFEADYQRLFTGFVTWVTTTFTDVSTELVMAMTGAASALFQGLGAAATTLTQITGYIGPTEATITRFEQDYQRLAAGFRLWAESAWTEETAATTTAVGNAVNALYQGLGTAATTLALIRNYTPASQQVIDRFITDMQNVMSTMLAWVQVSFSTEAQQIMTSFGNTTQTLFTGIGTALNVLQGIAQYTVPDSQFVLALQRFNANLLTAITSWQIWLVNTFTPEASALIQQFHNLMATIVADMQAALNLLMDIEQANLPTSEDLQAFLDGVAQLFQGIVVLFGRLSTDLEDLTVDLGAAFSNIFLFIQMNAGLFSAQMVQAWQGVFNTLHAQMWAWGDYAAGMFMSGLLAGMQNINSVNAVVNAMRDLAEQLEAELRAAWGLHSPSRVAQGIGANFVLGLERGLSDLQNIPTLIQRSLAMDGVTLGADVRYSPAPRHDYLTVQFQGAWQSGMSPAEEKRITQAMVGELRRQGLALQVARV